MLTGLFLLPRPSAGDFSRAGASSHALHCRRTRDSAPSEEEADSTGARLTSAVFPKGPERTSFSLICKHPPTFTGKALGDAITPNTRRTAILQMPGWGCSQEEVSTCPLGTWGIGSRPNVTADVKHLQDSSDRANQILIWSSLESPQAKTDFRLPGALIWEFSSCFQLQEDTQKDKRKYCWRHF